MRELARLPAGKQALLTEGPGVDPDMDASGADGETRP